MSEDNFPKLETIGADIHLALTVFTILPNSFVSIEGDVSITEEPKSLVEDCLLKKNMGVINGDIFLLSK